MQTRAGVFLPFFVVSLSVLYALFLEKCFIEMGKAIKSVFAVALVVLVQVNSSAQRGAIELAAGAGVSVNSTPTDNMPYKGDIVVPNYSTVLSGLYNFHRSMAVGLEVRSLGLSRKSETAILSAILPAPYDMVGGDDKRITYSKNAMSFCGVFNAKLNTYRGYFYGGPAIGYAFSVQDHGRMNNNTETYRTPDGGKGFVWGVQAGYTHGISAVLGINVEAALRNYSLSYPDNAYRLDGFMQPVPDLSYNITAYTITAGLKIRILPKYKAQNAIPAMRGKGRSKKVKPPRR